MLRIMMGWLLLAALAPVARTQQGTPSDGAATPQAAAVTPSADLTIGSGDLVEVRVFGVPELTQEIRVTNTGELPFPLIGRVPAEGRRILEVERDIEQRLVNGGFLKDPDVSLFVKEYVTQGASVLGEVIKPGLYPVLGNRRLFDILSLAGGLSDKAGKMVTIVRRSAPQEPLQVELSRDPAKATAANVEILPGDTIVVSRAGVVYVVGDVVRPGGFVMDKNDSLTVLQAIALAEGTRSTASLNNAKLIRKNGELREEIPLPLKAILAAKQADVPLQPNDIVFVPASAGKNAARRTIDAIVTITTGLVIYRR